MKLKCLDGKVRQFRTASWDDCFNTGISALCLECDKRFGVHDTKVLKPLFKQHICRITNEK